MKTDCLSASGGYSGADSEEVLGSGMVRWRCDSISWDEKHSHFCYGGFVENGCAETLSRLAAVSERAASGSSSLELLQSASAKCSD